MESQGCDLSIVIPVFNEREALPILLQRLHCVLEAQVDGYEVIVIDDGSTDGCFDWLGGQHATDKRVKALRLARHFGKEAALQAGLEHVHGRAIITMDADLQHPPELIPEMLSAWREGAGVVHGVKRQRPDNGLRRFASRCFNALFSRVAGFDLSESSDFKLLDRRVVRSLSTRFPEHGRFFRGLSLWVGGRQVNIPFDVQPRAGGQTAWGGVALIRYAVDALTSFSSLPLHLLSVLGGLMLVVALGLGMEALVSRLSGKAVSGFATLEITILFTGSLVMIGLGIIGQYLARLYDEVKHRPHYLVDDSIGLGEEASES